MKSKVWTVVCVLVAFGLVACGSGGGGSSSNNSGNTSSLAMKGTSGNAVNMNGTRTGCKHFNQAQQDQLIVANANSVAIAYSSSIWSATTTSNCQQTASPDAIMTVTQTASLGAEAAAIWTDESGSTSQPSGVPANAQATKVKSVYHSAIMTVNSASWVDSFNGDGMSGKTDWAVGVPTNVLNCTALIPSAKVVDYWVVDDSSTQLKLYDQTIGTLPYQVDSINPLLK